MKSFIAILCLSVVLLSCDEDFDSSVPCTQGVEATVRDLTGLDGCSYVFVLKDGTKLQPLRLLYCGTSPLPKEVTEDPLYNFEYLDGKKVIIGYEERSNHATACMAGKPVKITCLEEIDLELRED